MIANLTLFPYEPDWNSKVMVRADFNTVVSRESIPGSMARDSQRDFGRRTLTFTAWLQGDVRRSWDAFREVNPPMSLVGVPLWSDDGVELTVAANPGDTVIHVSETANIDWRAELILVNVGDRTEVPVCEGAAIDVVGGSTITLSAALSSAFPAGTKVLPLLRARNTKDYSDDILDEEWSMASFEFAEELVNLTACALGYTAPTFLGIPLFPLAVNQVDKSTAVLTKGTALVASGMNSEAFSTLLLFPRQDWKHTISFEDRASKAMLWQFFNDRRGRWQRFWLASIKNELKLSADVGSGDTTLQLQNFVDFSARFGVGGSLRRALFVLNGGTFWIRRVLNLSGGTNRINIDASFGTALKANATAVGMLELVHFITDDIELDLENAITGDAQLHFSELEREYTEVLATGGTANGSVTSDLELSIP